MVSTSNDFETWIYDQMHTVPASSLRKFYRERVNPKWEHSYFSGTVSSQPCEVCLHSKLRYSHFDICQQTNNRMCRETFLQIYSRWRKYAITSKDVFNNRKTDIYKILIVTHEAGIGYVWKVDGDFRTVTQEPPVALNYYASLEYGTEIPDYPAGGTYNNIGFQFQLGAKYRFKYTAYWQMDCVGCVIALLPPGGNSGFFGISNPPVNYAGYESQLEFNVLNLPTFKSTDFPVIDNPDEYFSGWEKFFGPDENAILNTQSLEGSAQCASMYNFRQPRLNNPNSPFEKEVWKTFPTIFGQSSDGHMFLYDPHLALPENSIENPSPDGGGQLVLDTHGLSGFNGYTNPYDGTTVGCQNAVMSYQNEENCKFVFLCVNVHA